MRTAIVGSGSLGIIIGALLAKAGQDVELVDIDADNVKALQTKGATVTGSMDLNVPVRSCLPGDMKGVYDLVLLLTKQVNNAAALPELLPHLGPNSTVCTLQNGIPEESVAAIVGQERTIGATVGFGATWQGPGVSALTSTMMALERYAFDIGEMDGAITPRLKAVQSVLGHVGTCTMVDNLSGVRWSKLLMNATFSGMSAACGCDFGTVLDSEQAMHFLSRIADETVKAAHACGVTMAWMQDFDFNQFELTPGRDLSALMPTYLRIWNQHRKLKASMLQDLEKGRKTEIAFINGHVCTKGQVKGLATPVNDMVVALVQQAEQSGKIPVFAESLRAFASIN